MKTTPFQDRIAGEESEESFFLESQRIELETTEDVLTLPLNWTRTDWEARTVAERMHPDQRSPEQEELLDRATIWPD